MPTEPDNGVEIICIDCDGTGREQIPCDDEEDCEFCGGLGTADVTPEKYRKLKNAGYDVQSV